MQSIHYRYVFRSLILVVAMLFLMSIAGTAYGASMSELEQKIQSLTVELQKLKAQSKAIKSVAGTDVNEKPILTSASLGRTLIVRGRNLDYISKLEFKSYGPGGSGDGELTRIDSIGSTSIAFSLDFYLANIELYELSVRVVGLSGHTSDWINISLPNEYYKKIHPLEEATVVKDTLKKISKTKSIFTYTVANWREGLSLNIEPIAYCKKNSSRKYQCSQYFKMHVVGTDSEFDSGVILNPQKTVAGEEITVLQSFYITDKEGSIDLRLVSGKNKTKKPTEILYRLQLEDDTTGQQLWFGEYVVK